MSLVLEPARGLKLVSLNEKTAEAADRAVASVDILQARHC
jgi:hypothetical protein